MFIKRRHKKMSNYKALVRRVIIDKIFDLKLDIYDTYHSHTSILSSGYKRVYKIPVGDINVKESIKYIKKLTNKYDTKGNINKGIHI